MNVYRALVKPLREKNLKKMMPLQWYQQSNWVKMNLVFDCEVGQIQLREKIFWTLGVEPMICPTITGWSYERKWPCDCTYSYAPRCQNDQKWPVFAFFIATFTLIDQIQNKEMSFASGIEHSILPPFKYLFIHSFIHSFIYPFIIIIIIIII